MPDTFSVRAKAAAAPYIKDEHALAVLGDLVSLVKVCESVLMDVRDDSVKAMAAQALHAFTGGLQSNPFWRNNAAYLAPVFNTTVGAWMDSFGYLAGGTATAEDRLAFMVTQNALPEIAIAVLYCEQGQAGTLKYGLELRKALLALQ